jgi:hypothetical protein
MKKQIVVLEILFDPRTEGPPAEYEWPPEITFITAGRVEEVES